MVQRQTHYAWIGYTMFVLSAPVTALSGCGDDSATGSGSTSSGSTSGGSTGGHVDPVYAYRTAVITPETGSRTDYIKFTSSLKADAKPDESKSIEMKNIGTIVFKATEPGIFFATDPSTGEVIKYKAGADGKIEESGRLSFAFYGVTAFASGQGGTHAAVVSPTKAYLFDYRTYQGFVWDPSKMEIISNVKLSASFNNQEGGKTYNLLVESSEMQWAGKKLVAAYAYHHPPTYTFLPRAGILMIDTETDTFSAVEHPKCGGFLTTAIGPDGYVYVTPVNLQAVLAYFASSTEPCLVRMDPAKGMFDSTYGVDLTKLIGKPAGSIVGQVGTSFYVSAFNETLLPPNVPKTAAIVIAGSPVWELYRLNDLANPTSATRVDAPLYATLPSGVYVDKRTYFTSWDLFGTKRTTLIDLSTDPPTPAFGDSGGVTPLTRVQ